MFAQGIFAGGNNASGPSGGHTIPSPFGALLAGLTKINLVASSQNGIFGVADRTGGIFTEVQLFKSPTAYAENWKKGGQDFFSNIQPLQTPHIGTDDGGGMAVT